MIKSFLPVEAEISVMKIFITANMKNSKSRGKQENIRFYLISIVFYTPTRREGAILQSPCPSFRLSVRSHFRNRYLSFYGKKWFTDDRDFRPQTCTNGLVLRECKHIKNIFEDVYFTKNSYHITLNMCKNSKIGNLMNQMKIPLSRFTAHLLPVYRATYKWASGGILFS
jgi:hypothetical protein